MCVDACMCPEGLFLSGNIRRQPRYKKLEFRLEREAHLKFTFHCFSYIRRVMVSYENRLPVKRLKYQEGWLFVWRAGITFLQFLPCYRWKNGYTELQYGLWAHPRVFSMIMHKGFFPIFFFLFLHLLQLEQIWNKFIFLFESLVKIKTQVGKGSSSKSKSIGPHQSLFF